MLFDGCAIVWTNLDINTNDAAFANGCAQTRVKDQGSAMGDACLYDDIRLNVIDNFLDPEHVFRKLDHWPPQPAKPVDIFCVPACPYPGI